MRILLILISIILLNSCENNEHFKLSGNDYRLFRKTPAWQLAKAVEAGNISKIEEMVKEKIVDVNYQEPLYGNTLLMLAISNNNYKSVKALLDVGADPNIKDNYRGGNAIIDAADNNDPKYLQILLQYKGDPNSVESIVVNEDNTPLQSALTSCLSFYDIHSLAKIKLLIEAGANVNYPNNDIMDIPLGVALKHNKISEALYLLQQGADYNRVMYKMIDGRKVYILEALRKCLFDLKSTEYQKKLEIIAFLKSKGLDYYKEPIPDYVLEDIKKKYTKNWEEYVQKY